MGKTVSLKADHTTAQSGEYAVDSCAVARPARPQTIDLRAVVSRQDLVN